MFYTLRMSAQADRVEVPNNDMLSNMINLIATNCFLVIFSNIDKDLGSYSYTPSNPKLFSSTEMGVK